MENRMCTRPPDRVFTMNASACPQISLFLGQFQPIIGPCQVLHLNILHFPSLNTTDHFLTFNSFTWLNIIILNDTNLSNDTKRMSTTVKGGRVGFASF
jgi:hypothetical protein